MWWVLRGDEVIREHLSLISWHSWWPKIIRWHLDQQLRCFKIHNSSPGICECDCTHQTMCGWVCADLWTFINVCSVFFSDTSMRISAFHRRRPFKRGALSRCSWEAELLWKNQFEVHSAQILSTLWRWHYRSFHCWKCSPAKCNANSN